MSSPKKSAQEQKSGVPGSAAFPGDPLKAWELDFTEGLFSDGARRGITSETS